ncbi:MAG: hypothetical protein AAFY41_01565 [Bacteroidota bacterium]
MKNKVLGRPVCGQNDVLLKNDDDLISGKSWTNVGYAIFPFLEKNLWSEVKIGFRDLFLQCLKNAGIETEDDFNIENYHTLVKGDQKTHLKVIDQTKLFNVSEFPIPIELVESRISEILGIKVRSIKPYNDERVFHFRVIRPGFPDYNPLHRDVWQEENRNAINI